MNAIGMERKAHSAVWYTQGRESIWESFLHGMGQDGKGESDTIDHDSVLDTSISLPLDGHASVTSFSFFFHNENVFLYPTLTSPLF